jgi:hypothetical protein
MFEEILIFVFYEFVVKCQKSEWVESKEIKKERERGREREREREGERERER